MGSVRSVEGRRTKRGGVAAVALVLAAGLGACSSSSGVVGGSSPTAVPAESGDSSLNDRMASFLFGPKARTPDPTAGGAAPDIDCPGVDVRSGASTFSAAATSDATAAGVRYQATIGQTARECAVLGSTLTIKVGMQGRMILGPTGTPGTFEVPIRFALVQEGPEPKTVWTKFYRVPVTVPPGQSNVPFVHVEEDLTVPVPKPNELSAYVVYVGFDPQGAKEKPARKPAAKQKKAGKPG